MNLSAMNATNDTLSMRIDPQARLGFLVLEIFFLVMTIYLMTSLSYFQWKTVQSSQQSGVKQRKLLFGFLLFYAINCAMKNTFELWVYYVPLSSGTISHCVLVTKIFEIVYTIGLMTLYLFLWLRQYILYQEPLLSPLSTPCLNRSSQVLPILIVLAGIIGLSSFAISNYEDDYIITEDVCIYHRKASSLSNYIRKIIFGLMIPMQCYILFLFIYILLRYRNSQSSLQLQSGSATTSGRINHLLRNCTIAALISVLSDFCTIIVNSFIATGDQLINHGIWDIDGFVNLACITFCFSDWKDRLWPWYKMEKRENSNISGSTLPNTSVAINLDK